MNYTGTLDRVNDDVMDDNSAIFLHTRNVVEQLLQGERNHVTPLLYKELTEIAETWLANLRCSTYSWPERAGKEPASMITFAHKGGGKGPSGSERTCALVLRPSRADVYSYDEHPLMYCGVIVNDHEHIKRRAEEIVDNIIEAANKPSSEEASDWASERPSDWILFYLRPKSSINSGFEFVSSGASSDLRCRIYYFLERNLSKKEANRHEKRVPELHSILVDALCKDIKIYIANAVDAINPPYKDILLSTQLLVQYNWVLAVTGLEQMRRAVASRLWTSAIGFIDVNRIAGDVFITINPSVSERIDAGKSALSVFTQDFGVKPHVARALMRNSHGLQRIGYTAEKLKPYTSFLNEMDPRAYPHEETHEAFFFRYAVDYVQAYASVFKRDPLQVMRSLVKGMDLSSTQKWQDALWSRTTIQRKALKKTDEETDVELLFQPKKLVNEFKRNAAGIKDMQADIHRRIIVPLFLLEFEKQGYEVLKLENINDIVAIAEQELWAQALPSEQLAASSFWHSKRVDFPTRRETAARIKHDTVWETILDEPYEIQVDDREVVFVPMKSDADLRKEADAHSHCVHGYGIECLKDAWHIFSLRGVDGNNLSTLSCRNTSVKNGRQQVELKQNAAYKNDPPPPHAEKAGLEFIRRINAGELTLRWEAVHANRAMYLRDEINTTVGYDFHDPLQRERIAKVYIPLMPRRITGALRAGLDTLGKNLGIRGIVEEFISKSTTRMGDLGLINIRQPNTTDVPYATKLNP